MTTTRIVIAGGGFGGLWTAGRLERLLGREPGVEIVVVCRDNYFLMTPLLFEACSGTLDVRHCSLPVREFLRRVRFVEATVHGIDFDRPQSAGASRRVRLSTARGRRRDGRRIQGCGVRRGSDSARSRRAATIRLTVPRARSRSATACTE